MEHLPEFLSSSLPRPEVPYLCEQKYDGLGFASYPQRRGWDSERLKAGDFDEHPVNRTCAFLQEWLFFGLLGEFFGPDFDSDDFITRQEGKGRLLITTRKLVEYAKALYKRIKSMSHEQRLQHDAFIRPVLLEAAGVCFARITDAEPNCPLSDEVRMSMIVVGETLDYILHHMWSSKGTELDVSRWFGSGRTSAIDWGDCRLLKTRMAAAGWCPNEIKRLARSKCNNAMFYASCLKRSTPDGFHRDCTESKCVAYQIKHGHYKTRHVFESCDCAFVHIEVDKVKEILGRGSIPLVEHTTEAESFSGKMSATEYRPGLGYVAISHVWSDGLGNEMCNALPTCRIQYLARAARKALKSAGRPGMPTDDHEDENDQNEPILFWIDTLCVPRAEGDMNFRKIAILRIEETFRSASCVLVLDAELQQHSIGSLEEALFRIYCSGWMRRLWTLKEGVLGEPHLYVAFQDGQLCVDDARETLWEREDNDPAICHPLISYVTSTAVRSISQTSGSHRISWILSELRWRTTSWRDDFEIVVAQLVGVDPAAVMRVPLEDRMQTIYSLLTEYPQFIIFNPGQRIQQDGYRWAPSSIPSSDSQNVRRQPGQISAEGLIVTYPALVAVEKTSTVYRMWDSRFYVRVRSNNSFYCVLCRESEVITPSPLLEQCSSRQLVILFDPLFLRLMSDQTRQHWEGMWFSACTAVKYKEVEGRGFAIYRHSAKISRVSEEAYAAWVTAPTSDDDAERHHVSVEQTSETSSWCVG
jgi:hypothetical protein